MAASGSTRLWNDYRVGERIDHPGGMTLDESDHTLATKLYQNTAKVHFDALAMAATPHGRRLVYGGHVISVCRALSYDGLENVVAILGINAGSHRAPTFAGDTLYCFSEVTEKIELEGRSDCGLLRLRLIGLSNVSPYGFEPLVNDGGKPRFRPDVVLDLDYTVLMPRASVSHVT
jgi:2-methylfumaryl-CoA hydratase